MLGIKIMITGFIAVFVSSCAMAAIGPYPGLWKGLPLLIAFAGGAVAVIAGLLMAVWL